MGNDAMSDREAITQLMARYNHLMDSYRREEFAGLFTSEGGWELVGQTTHRGTGALRDFIASIERSAGAKAHRHCVFNEVIEVLGDEANEESYVMDWVCAPGEPPNLIALGRYKDRLQRVNGSWLFAYRRLECDWLASRDAPRAKESAGSGNGVSSREDG